MQIDISDSLEGGREVGKEGKENILRYAFIGVGREWEGGKEGRREGKEEYKFMCVAFIGVGREREGRKEGGKGKI